MRLGSLYGSEEANAVSNSAGALFLGRNLHYFLLRIDDDYNRSTERLIRLFGQIATGEVSMSDVSGRKRRLAG